MIRKTSQKQEKIHDPGRKAYGNVKEVKKIQNASYETKKTNKK